MCKANLSSYSILLQSLLFCSCAPIFEDMCHMGVKASLCLFLCHLAITLALLLALVSIVLPPLLLPRTVTGHWKVNVWIAVVFFIGYLNTLLKHLKVNTHCVLLKNNISFGGCRPSKSFKFWFAKMKVQAGGIGSISSSTLLWEEKDKSTSNHIHACTSPFPALTTSLTIILRCNFDVNTKCNNYIYITVCTDFSDSGPRFQTKLSSYLPDIFFLGLWAQNLRSHCQLSLFSWT